MKRFLRMYGMVGGLAVLLSMTAGCILFAVGVGAGAGVGAVAYYDNELRATREITVDRGWNAAQAAMKDMAYTIIPAETHKDGAGGVVQGRNAKDQVVRIQLIRQTDKTTEIRVRVGTFGMQNDRDAEQALFEKLTTHL